MHDERLLLYYNVTDCAANSRIIILQTFIVVSDLLLLASKW